MDRRFSPLGDCGVRISFGHNISPSIGQKMMNVKRKIEESGWKGITDIVPSYTTLSVFYDPFEMTYVELCMKLEILLTETNEQETVEPSIYHIPVCYEEPFNIDLKQVAHMNQLTEREVIEIHSERLYYIYMLGFLPGFPYLGGMDTRIATPRLHTPRLKVTAGSVGIAGEQTGIYPIESPGGWRIIGKTPIEIYSPDRETPILFSSGHYVHFYPVTYEEYLLIERDVKKGNFRVKTTIYKGEEDVSN